MFDLPARLALIALFACVVLPAADPGALYGTATLAFPAGTKAVASFQTQEGHGADKLIDGDEQTVMMGAPGTVSDPTAPVWVDITFGKPVENLLGVVTGESDKFQNYFPKKADVLVDSNGDGTFDTIALAGVKLGPASQAAGQHRFAKPVAKAFALRFLVTEQNKAGIGRAFSLTSLGLLADRPAGVAPAPVARTVQVPEAGDRQIRMNIVYPKGAFKENGGPVINIRNPPFSAIGDGKADDTAAFIKVLDFIATEQRGNRRNWIVYLPKGTYLVSDALVSQQDAGKDGFCYFRLIGQDRVETVIRLTDKAPGFGDAGKPKTLLPWEGIKPGQGNILWGNIARNFTIDTGTGNPGAIAMTFMGANATSMDNITLRSGDGQGAIGLHFSWWSVQGHYVDEVVAYQTVAGGVVARYYPHYNHLYSVAALTDASGAVVERFTYNAYGTRTVTTPGGTVLPKSNIGFQRGFTGYQLDEETGLYYARNRMYSAQMGRFVNRDPLGYVDGMSLYMAYFAPNGLDPFGLSDLASCIQKATKVLQMAMRLSMARLQVDIGFAEVVAAENRKVEVYQQSANTAIAALVTIPVGGAAGMIANAAKAGVNAYRVAQAQAIVAANAGAMGGSGSLMVLTASERLAWAMQAAATLERVAQGLPIVTGIVAGMISNAGAQEIVAGAEIGYITRDVAELIKGFGDLAQAAAAGAQVYALSTIPANIDLSDLAGSMMLYRTKMRQAVDSYQKSLETCKKECP